MRIAHVITRLILGGAQENTVLTCEDLLRDPRRRRAAGHRSAAGARGKPARARAAQRRAAASCRTRCGARFIRCAMRRATLQIKQRDPRRFGPTSFTRTAARRACWVAWRRIALGVPAIVHTVHGAPFHPYQGRGARALFRWCERYAAARCRRAGERGRRHDRSAGRGRRRAAREVHHHLQRHGSRAVSGRRRAPRARCASELGYRDEHVVVGKIARLFHLKGHEYRDSRRRAGRRTRSRNVRFLFVGDGILADAIREQVRRAGLESLLSIHRPGAARARFPGCIGAMDIVVHTSLREGLARVLPQALDRRQAGRQLRRRRCARSRDRRRDRLSAAAREHRRAGRRASADWPPIRHLRERLGAEGRRRFTDQFRHEHMTRQLRALYERILLARKPARDTAATTDARFARVPRLLK